MSKRLRGPKKPLRLQRDKRIGDLQALRVLCREFAPGMVKAFLYLRPGYVHEVPKSTLGPIVLQAFCPPPFQEACQEKLNLLYPVRAQDTAP